MAYLEVRSIQVFTAEQERGFQVFYSLVSIWELVSTRSWVVIWKVDL